MNRAYGVDLDSYTTLISEPGSLSHVLVSPTQETTTVKTYPGEDGYGRLTTFGAHLTVVRPSGEVVREGAR